MCKKEKPNKSDLVIQQNQIDLTFLQEPNGTAKKYVINNVQWERALRRVNRGTGNGAGAV